SADARLERLFHLALKARVGVDDVPLHVRVLGSFGGTFSGSHCVRIARVGYFRLDLLVALVNLVFFHNSLWRPAPDFLFVWRIDYRDTKVRKAQSRVRPMMPSTIQKYPAKMKTVIITTAVVACTSLRVGDVTLRISFRTSPRKLLVRLGRPFIFPAVLSLSTFATTAFAISIPNFPGRGRLCWRLIRPLHLVLLKPVCQLVKAGRGGGIRTPKFGFGDRQF